MTGFISGRSGLRDLFVTRLFNGLSMPWIALSILLIPVLALIAALLAAGLGGAEFQLVKTEIFPLILMLFLISIGEEFGWARVPAGKATVQCECSGSRRNCWGDLGVVALSWIASGRWHTKRFPVLGLCALGNCVLNHHSLGLCKNRQYFTFDFITHVSQCQLQLPPDFARKFRGVRWALVISRPYFG